MSPTVHLRLQLGIASNPPVPPLDLNTGQPPKVWNNGTLVIDIGIFNQKGASVDLSDIEQLEVDIFPALIFNQVPGTNYTYSPATLNPFPPLPPAPLIFETVEQADIDPTVSNFEWTEGNAQQARVVFNWSKMAQLDLGGKSQRDFWIVVHGRTVEGLRANYGACVLPVYDGGNRNVYLPNNLAPLVVPDGTILYIAPNQQLPYSTPIDIEGTVVIDGGSLVQY